MAKVVSVFALMVLLAVIVEGRNWSFESAQRVKRGYKPSGFGNSDTYGRSDEHNASGSKERLGCSDEEGGGSYGSGGSHELSYNSRPSDKRHRSFSKASASASASSVAFNQDHKTKL